MVDQIGGVRDCGVDHSPGSAERDPPPVPGRHPYEAAHHQQHRHSHEGKRTEDCQQANPAISSQCHPDAERNDHERDVFFDEQRKNNERGVQTPPGLEREIDREPHEHT